MKKKQQQHYYTTGGAGGSAPSNVVSTTALGHGVSTGIKINNIVVNNSSATAGGQQSQNPMHHSMIAGVISQSSSTTNAANSLNTSHHKGAGPTSSSVSSAAKKRNTIPGGPQSSISGTNQGDLLNKQHQMGGFHGSGSLISGGAGPVPKKVNNFVIDATAFQSAQHLATKNGKQNQTACHSTKSSQGGPNSHHHAKTHSSGATTTKHSVMKNGQNQAGWKFVERRLSAKILHQEGGSTSNSVGPATKKNQPILSHVNGVALGASKGSIQYENLMLQHLLKQSHKQDPEKSGGGPGFKKNLSMISIDQHGNPTSTPAVALGTQAPAPTIGAPHMLLNISYNMNNNIDANSAAQFVFHQHPQQSSATALAGALPQGDPLQHVLAAAQHHHPLTNQQQQQIRQLIGLATGAGSSQSNEHPMNMATSGQNGTMGGPNNSSAVSGVNSDHHHHPLIQQTVGVSTTGTGTHPLMEAAALAHQAQYKTQVDSKKIKQSQISSNPYHTNASSSMLGEGMMTYENSIVQAVKQHSDMRYREQSFDQIKRKRRSVNTAGASNVQGINNRSKQQLSSNSGRRATVAASHKAISQQATQNPNSRSTSSKRKVDGKASQPNNQNFKVDSQRGMMPGGHQIPGQNSQQTAHQYHQSKKNVQKRSIEQAKLKVKGSFSQPPELQNQRALSGHQAANTAPAHQGILFPQPHPSSHILTPASMNSTVHTEKDRYLLNKLNEALERDLLDKSSTQRVAICSKVWSEIIRRQDPVIQSLLSKIKQNYEHHVKHQAKQITSTNNKNAASAAASSNPEREQALEKELAAERESRRCADEKVESLGQEVSRLQMVSKKQEDTIAEMKKQILAYRREIIDLSSNNKAFSAGGHYVNHHNSKSEGRRVPRLDLSKLHRDSEIGDDNDDGESCISIHDPALDGGENDNGKNVTYQQYLKFLENEQRIPDELLNNPDAQQHFLAHHGALPPPDQLGEESQESLIRQEELKQRKNKIIQLLNGDISDDEDGRGPGEEDEDEMEQEEEEEDEDGDNNMMEEQAAGYQEDEDNIDGENDEYFEGGVGEETELFQQRMNVGQFTAELKSANIVVQKGGHQVTEEDQLLPQNSQPDEESHQIDLVAAANLAAKARASNPSKYQMLDKPKNSTTQAPKNFKFDVYDDHDENSLFENDNDNGADDGNQFDARQFLVEMENNEKRQEYDDDDDDDFEVDPEVEEIIAAVNFGNKSQSQPGKQQQQQQHIRSKSYS